MVYLFAFVGFVTGFAVGLGIINILLHNRSVSEIRKDKSATTLYGIFVWLIAFVGGFIAVWLHGLFY